MNFEGLELILQASLPVQIILAILCLASLLSWVLIFEKYFSLTRSVKSSHEIEDRFWEGQRFSVDMGILGFCVHRHRKKNGVELLWCKAG